MAPPFRREPDPEHPGWTTWELPDHPGFLSTVAPVRVRPEGERRGRVRMWPRPSHANYSNVIHGGAIMGFVDVALFAGAYMCGVESAGEAVTLDCSVQFLAPGLLDQPLDAAVELLRETGRMIFLRGMLEQGDRQVAAFSATLRKASTAG